MMACERLADGVPWHRAGVINSKGCGSAMRVAPVGLRFHRDPARLLEVARASSLLTHGHDAAVEGAATAALLVALAIERASPEDMYRAVAEECCPRSPDFAACWARLPGLLDAPPEVALSDDAEAIPAPWRDALENAAMLVEIADALRAACEPEAGSRHSPS